MKDISTALPTHQEAKSALDSLLVAFSDSAPLDEALIETATLGIAKGVQFRDYSLGAIGLTLGDPADSLAFIEALKTLGNDSPALEALKAAYAYEAGNKALAMECIENALSLENGHSLALLLRRVFGAGWPPASFVSMRNSLHPKVTQSVEEFALVTVGQE